MHPKLYMKHLSSALLRRNTSVITNTSAAHFYAIRSGAGLGFLPTYAGVLSDRIVPIDVGKTVRREIRLVFHPDVRRIRRVEYTLDWITGIFSKHRFPWFSDEFIHPDGNWVTDAFLAYCRPLLGTDLPSPHRFRAPRVAKILNA